MSTILKIRKDTVDKSHGTLLNLNKQQFVGILGARGSGKSYLGDTFLEMYHRKGYTCLDLFSAPFYENYFWCMPKQGLNADGKPFTKRIPITIIAPESLIIDQDGIDTFNNHVNTRYPLVRVSKIPTATVKPYSEQNDKILEIITVEILKCRSERRILCFNTSIFPIEKVMYLTLEIIFRGILKVANEHFDQLTPEDLGRPLTKTEKNHHKMAFQLREIGSLFPSLVKGDQSGYSKNTKKGFLEFVRLARHGSIDGVFDYQSTTDVMGSIRNQIDVWCIKKWNKQLASEQFEWIFKTIKAKREKIAEHFRFSKSGWIVADSSYPTIESLNKTWFYGLIDGYNPKLFPVPPLGIRHKEPVDKWQRLTGIKLIHDQSMIVSAGNTGRTKVTKKDEKELFLLMQKEKSVKGVKWRDVADKLAKMQEDSTLVCKYDMKTISEQMVSAIFSRLKKKYTLD
jgi:energy-coupling factor transporter ATP-binding protein EcfA2